MGLLAAYRQRRKIGLAKKEAETKRKREVAERKEVEIREALIRDAVEEAKKDRVREEAEVDGEEGDAKGVEEMALAWKGEVEARERGKRRNRI